MFENEGDKKKKCIPLARYVGQEGYTLLRDSCKTNVIV